MACVTWKLPDGTTYLIPEGKAHIPVPGAVIVPGLIDWTCAGGMQQNEVDAMLEKQGIQWGSAIKWVAQKAGIKQCSGCKAREVILNHVKELGWIETLRQIKETF